MKWSLVFVFGFAVLECFAEQSEFLKVSDAFPFHYSIVGGKVNINFETQAGYYLYRSRFQLSSDETMKLRSVTYSTKGMLKTDKYFGQSVVFEQPVSLSIPYEGYGKMTLQYQGCAIRGLCYLPQSIEFIVPKQRLTQG